MRIQFLICQCLLMCTIFAGVGSIPSLCQSRLSPAFRFPYCSSTVKRDSLIHLLQQRQLWLVSISFDQGFRFPPAPFVFQNVRILPYLSLRNKLLIPIFKNWFVTCILNNLCHLFYTSLITDFKLLQGFYINCITTRICFRSSAH